MFWRWGRRSRFSRVTPPDLEAPDREPTVEPEFDEAAGGRVGRPADDRLDADRGVRAVGQAKPLVEPAEHHHPAERGGQRSDQQAVVAPGGDAAGPCPWHTPPARW